MSDFSPGYSMKRVCAWCEAFMGLKTCSAEQHGQISHGICPACHAEHFPEEFPEELRDGAVVARHAHTVEVAGSIPAPETNFNKPDLTPEDLAEMSAVWLVNEVNCAVKHHAPIVRLLDLKQRLAFAQRQLAAILR